MLFCSCTQGNTVFNFYITSDRQLVAESTHDGKAQPLQLNISDDLRTNLDEEKVKKLQTMFEQNRFIVRDGIVVVNEEESSVGAGNVFGVLFGLGQIAAGVTLTVMSGGLGAVGGVALISSGLSGTMHAATTDAEHLTIGGYFKQTAIGGAMGAVSGGVGSLGVGCGTAARVLISAAGGVAGKTAGGTTKMVIDSVAKGEWQLPEYSGPKELLWDVGGAALAGGLGGAAGLGSDSATKKAAEKCISPAKKVLFGALYGGAGGAAGSASARLAHNACASKGGWLDGVGEAAATGAILGASTTAIRARDIPTKVEPQRGPIILKQGTIISNSGGKTVRVTREHMETAAKYGSVDVDTGLPIPPDMLAKMRRDNTSKDMNDSGSQDTVSDNSKDRPSPFFSDHRENIETILKKLGWDPSSPQTKELLAILKNNEMEGPLIDVAKQQGHNRAEALREVQGVRCKNFGRILLATSRSRIIQNSGGLNIVKLEGNAQSNSIKNRLYIECKLLCETQNIKLSEALSSSIKELTQAYQSAVMRETIIKGIVHGVTAFEDLISRVEHSPEIDTLSSTIFKEIVNLKDGESYLLPSGFFVPTLMKNNPNSDSSSHVSQLPVPESSYSGYHWEWIGHATYHKFTNENGKIVAEIYNGGGGSSCHQTTAEGMLPYKLEAPANLRQYIRDLETWIYSSKTVALDKIYAKSSKCMFFQQQPLTPTGSAYPTQTVGNCSLHNLTVSQAEHFRIDGEDFSDQVMQYELDTMKRLRVERQGYNYEEVLRSEKAIKETSVRLRSHLQRLATDSMQDNPEDHTGEPPAKKNCTTIH